MPTPTTLEIEFGGRTLTLETGKLAGLAGGAVTLRYGDTLVLGTANRSLPRPGLDFFPLTVEFEERMYAAGKIPGGFIKREGRMSEAATLAARLTDRPIRPLFPEGYKDDVQLVITVLSTDQENDPDILGTIAASAALTISEIPFQGPVGAVRVGRIDGEFVLNPTYTELAGVRARPGRLRHPRRDHDGRGRGQDPPRGRDGRGDPVRPARRSLPLIEIQDKLRELVGKPKLLPYLEPLTDSVLKFADLAKAGGEFVVVDVETTGTDPKMADLVEVAAVRVKGGKITDRWSTLVNPGRPIVGNQMHGITDKDVKGAPSPAEAARKALDFVGDAPFVGHSVGFDIAFLEEALGDGTRVAQGTLPRHARHRPRGLPGSRELQARDPGQLLRRRADREPPRPAGRRGHREPADLVRQRPARPHRDPQGRHRRRDPRDPHATRTRPLACSRRPAATRASARACSGSSRRRSSASSCSARASAWTAAPPTRSARSRSRSASCRVRTAPACSPAARPRR